MTYPPPTIGPQKENIPGRISSPHPSSNGYSADESVLDGFISALAARNASPRTIQAYKHDISLFLSATHFNSQTGVLSKVDEQLVRQFLESLLNSDTRLSTLKRMLSSLREFFTYLKDSNAIAHNPCTSISIKSLCGRSLPLSDILRTFAYVRQHQESPPPNIAVRYFRDESVLLFMLLLGVRQYLIPSLTLDTLQRKEGGIVLVVAGQEVASVPALVLSRLRAYLSNDHRSPSTCSPIRSQVFPLIPMPFALSAKSCPTLSASIPPRKRYIKPHSISINMRRTC